MTDDKELTEKDIVVGGVYRAKRFRGSLGFNNDRRVVWISKDRKEVQYDSDTVGIGRHYPRISMEKFLRWAKTKQEKVKP